mmetsp:Transcript_8376/g.26042  ORF Transcript_8376/g.26042 Transcript_8376/m.26042 type:complete len:231 (-) Transcript_8376:202-894(-)
MVRAKGGEAGRDDATKKGLGLGHVDWTLRERNAEVGDGVQGVGVRGSVDVGAHGDDVTVHVDRGVEALGAVVDDGGLGQDGREAPGALEVGVRVEAVDARVLGGDLPGELEGGLEFGVSGENVGDQGRADAPTRGLREVRVPVVGVVGEIEADAAGEGSATGWTGAPPVERLAVAARGESMAFEVREAVPAAAAAAAVVQRPLVLETHVARRPRLWLEGTLNRVFLTRSS